jgi:flagellar motor switch protein FliN
MADSEVNRFLQVFSDHLGRALEPILRERPLVSCSRARHLAAVNSNQMLWWQAKLRVTETFSLWIGAPDQTWARAGKLRWVRLLESVIMEAAKEISHDLTETLYCGAAQVVHEKPSLEGLLYAVVGLRLLRTELLSLLIALEPAGREQMDFRASQAVVSPMLRNLLELELPLSVALGRTKLPIGEVLKVTSGSVIRLQGYTGDEVEVIVQGVVVAKGQVVSSKGCFGVRIREILSPTERLQLCMPEE